MRAGGARPDRGTRWRGREQRPPSATEPRSPATGAGRGCGQSARWGRSPPERVTGKLALSAQRPAEPKRHLPAARPQLSPEASGRGRRRRRRVSPPGPTGLSSNPRGPERGRPRSALSS